MIRWLIPFLLMVGAASAQTAVRLRSMAWMAASCRPSGSAGNVKSRSKLAIFQSVETADGACHSGFWPYFPGYRFPKRSLTNA
jgi:hypothetical protein